jgi:hypothetical protein
MPYIHVLNKNGGKIMINTDLLGENKIRLPSHNNKLFKRPKKRICAPGKDIDDDHNRQQKRRLLKLERESCSEDILFLNNYHWFYTLIQAKVLDELGYHFLK